MQRLVKLSTVLAWQHWDEFPINYFEVQILVKVELADDSCRTTSLKIEIRFLLVLNLILNVNLHNDTLTDIGLAEL
jgi:hypothetical protein